MYTTESFLIIKSGITPHLRRTNPPFMFQFAWKLSITPLIQLNVLPNSSILQILRLFRVPSTEAVDTIVVTIEDYYNDFLHMKPR